MQFYDALATITDFAPHIDGLLRAGPVDLPAGHPVFRHLTKAITERDVQLRAISLLSILSQRKANRDSCLRCLLSVGGTMEFLLSKFPVPSAAVIPMGKTANAATLSVTSLASLLNPLPQIHIDLISILINVCDYKIDAAQFLELYNNDVVTCINAMCGFLRYLTVEYPLSVMLVASSGGGASAPPTDDVSASNAMWAIATAQSTAVIRCVYELSTWRTFKEAFYSGASDQTDIAMPIIQAKFTDHIQLVNKTLTASPFLPLITRQLEDWLDVINVLPDPHVSAALIPIAEAALSNALLLITNMMSFTHEFTAKFRQYAALNSGGLMEKVMMPMLSLELDILDGKRFTDADDCFDNASHLARAARMVQTLLKVLGLLCFKVRALRPTLLSEYPFLCKRLITNEALMGSDFKVEFFALVARFAVNAELEDSIPTILEQHKTKLDQRQRLVLALRLNNPAERLYPINVFCPVYRQLRQIFFVDKAFAESLNLASLLTETANTAASTPKFNFSLNNNNNNNNNGNNNNNKTIEEKRDARRKAFGFVAAGIDPIGTFEDNSQQQHVKRIKRRQGGTSMNDKLKNRREALRRRRAFLARKARLLALSGASAAFGSTEGGEDAVVEVEGDDDVDVDDADEGEEMKEIAGTSNTKEAIIVDEEVENNDSASSSSSPASPSAAADCFENAIIAGAMESRQQQQADTTTVKTKDASPTATAAAEAISSAPAVVRLTASAASESIAPATATEAYVQTGPFDLRPYRTVPPPFGVDSRYLCALTKQLMTTPVISPYGDVFEKESILAFIKTVGPHKNKCPLTGEDLYSKDLVVDSSLKKELAIVAANYR